MSIEEVRNVRKSQAERNRSDHSWARIPGAKTMGNLFRHTHHSSEERSQRRDASRREASRRDAKEAAAPAASSSQLFGKADTTTSLPSRQKQPPSILRGGEASEKSQKAVAEVSFKP